MTEREKVTVHRIEYGPTAHDVKVILSDGKQLDALLAVEPKPVTVCGLCIVSLEARLKAPASRHDGFRLVGDRGPELEATRRANGGPEAEGEPV